MTTVQFGFALSILGRSFYTSHVSHRVIRLSISPDDAPEPRRIIDLDGHASLADVHAMTQEPCPCASGKKYEKCHGA